MDTKPSGTPKVLTILLCILLVVSIVLNVVLVVNNNDLNKKTDALNDSNASLTTELDDMTAVAAQSESDLLSAQETIGELEAQAAVAEETIASQLSSIDTLQTDVAAAEETIASQASALDALQAEYTGYQADAEETIAFQASALDALQTEYTGYQADAQAAIAQGEADLKAAQDDAAATLASLQADFDALQAELDAYLAETAAADAETETAVADASDDEAADTSIDEETVAEETAPSFASDTVLATVNGEDVTGEEMLSNYQQLVNYYGEPDASSLELYYAVALEEAITLQLIYLTAAEYGVDQLTEEEIADIYATSDSELDSALDNYVSYYYTFTDVTSDEEREAAYAEAEAYYVSLGYSRESLRQSYLENEIYERVKAELCKEVTVTDEDVQAYYDEAVQADKDIYENDIDAYETQIMMVQYGYADSEPWYKPVGYRYVKHILLEVDEELLTEYTGLLALYEEAEDETVTAEDVEAARLAILESVQATVDEINQKLADGAVFEDLIAEYGSDPGMTNGEYPDGYEVAEASYGFVNEFVAAAFSVDAIGDVSEPFISEYGVHIVKYIGDVPAGGIELTAELHDSIYQSMLDEQCNTVLDAWHDTADIVYLGVIRSLEEVQADDAE